MYIRSYTLTFEPWKDWHHNIASMEPNPEWWTAHNKLKHRRQMAYSQANLKNVMDAVAALLILNFHFIKATFPKKLDYVVYETITPKPCLFYLNESKYLDYKGITMRMQKDRLLYRR